MNHPKHMDQGKTLHFNPPAGLKPKENDPQAASSARARIAGLPSQYHTVPMPTKEEIANSFKPVSPVANAQPLKSELPSLESIKETLALKKAGETVQVNSKPALSTGAAAHSHIPIQTTSKAKAKRKLPSSVRPILAAIMTFALLTAVFKSPLIFSQFEYFNKKPVAAPVMPAVATVSTDPVIEIPKINVNAPVVYLNTNAEASVQKALEGGVVHYAGTALPGQNGNSVIVGHSSNDWWEPGNYKFVFVLLDKLVIGDTFSINYNSQKYIYTVTESKVVEPTDLSVLAPTAEPTVTLITCTPPGTAWKRLIIKAKQTSPSPTPTAAAENKNLAPVGDLPGDSPGLSETLRKIWDSITNIFTDKSETAEPKPASGGALPGS